MKKYPSTPYHPASPSLGTRADRIHQNPERFVGAHVIISEKLDGSNTLIHQGQVYGRSVEAPSTNKWMAMVKKHHAWKVTEPDIYVYGENLFGVHSIEYDAMPEDRTFRVFAVRKGDIFLDTSEAHYYAAHRDMAIVPQLYAGRAMSNELIEKTMSKPEGRSDLGGEREGFVMRIKEAFHVKDFSDCVCKSVRRNHVQTDEHWTRNWRPCKLKE